MAFQLNRYFIVVHSACADNEDFYNLLTQIITFIPLLTG